MTVSPADEAVIRPVRTSTVAIVSFSDVQIKVSESFCLPLQVESSTDAWTDSETFRLVSRGCKSVLNSVVQATNGDEQAVTKVKARNKKL
jgi:hypothetical protein